MVTGWQSLILPLSRLSVSPFFFNSIWQPVNRNGGNASLPPEGKNATASLFALIVQAELKGNYFLVALVPEPFVFLIIST